MNEIRNKIVIPDDHNFIRLTIMSDIGLAALFSKNQNNFDIFKELLLKINKINIINNILRNIIRHTNKFSSIHAIKLLIDHGADINYIDSQGTNILLYYCSFYYDDLDIKVINLLIDSGCHVNILNINNDSVLALVCKHKNITADYFEIIKLLIRKGVNVNSKNIISKTALMLYIEYHFDNYEYNIIKLFLDNKVDIYLKNDYGKNIFDILENKKSKNSDIYSLLFNYKNLNNDHFCEYDIDFIYDILYKN